MIERMRGGVVALVFVLVAIPVAAQNVTGTKSVGTEKAAGSSKVMQIPLEQCERVDTCEVARYAIVQKDGKCGIYDLERHENVTGIGYDAARFARRAVEDGIEIFFFHVKKSTKRGLVGVVSENNETLEIW